MVTSQAFVVNTILFARRPSAPSCPMAQMIHQSPPLPRPACEEWILGRDSTHRRIEGAAIEQQVLADDEPRGGGAQKGAGVAEFRGIADPAGRGRLAALGKLLLERDVLPPRLVFDARAQPVGQKRSGQQAV